MLNIFIYNFSQVDLPLPSLKRNKILTQNLRKNLMPKTILIMSDVVLYIIFNLFKKKCQSIQLVKRCVLCSKKTATYRYHCTLYLLSNYSVFLCHSEYSNLCHSASSMSFSFLNNLIKPTILDYRIMLFYSTNNILKYWYFFIK